MQKIFRLYLYPSFLYTKSQTLYRYSSLSFVMFTWGKTTDRLLLSGKISLEFAFNLSLLLKYNRKSDFPEHSYSHSYLGGGFTGEKFGEGGGGSRGPLETQCFRGTFFAQLNLSSARNLSKMTNNFCEIEKSFAPCKSNFGKSLNHPHKRIFNRALKLCERIDRKPY